MTSADTTRQSRFYHDQPFAPVTEEVTSFDLPTRGSIPPQLRGRYLRNGPNPRAGDPGHWFFGDGMIHGVELADGRARWYRNRWVRTPSFTGERELMSPTGGYDLYAGGPSNTHVVGHAGKIFSLFEGCLPTEITPELDTVGPYDFGGRLSTAMTAHPKVCPLTGELHFFGNYAFTPPYMTYHCADAAGNIVRSVPIDLPAPTMIHDFAITERHVIFMDLPMTLDLERVGEGTMPYRWNDDYGARVGVMPRGTDNAQPRWFDVEPCYAFHVLNAFDDPTATQVTVDIARYPHLWLNSTHAFADANLHRWTIDLESGKVLETPLNDTAIEFPRINERRVGLPHRYGYGVRGYVGALSRESPAAAATRYEHAALAKYDLVAGTVEHNPFTAGQIPGEAVFVPAHGAPSEDEGWVISCVYDATRDSTELVILDATNFTGDPVAAIAMPQRVPLGFHGSWIPAGSGAR